MGMDWHSSGITTSVIGALKRGLAPLSANSASTSAAAAAAFAADAARAGRDRRSASTAPRSPASRLVAKVDSAAVQDGFDLYLHGFIVTDDGKWVVVQQGMNGDSRQARRYHWLRKGLTSFVDAPHAAIDGAGQGEIVNLTDRRAEASRRGRLDILAIARSRRIGAELARLGGSAIPSEPAPIQPDLPHLVMPAHHDVRPSDVVARRLHGTWPRPPIAARRFRRPAADAGRRRADRALAGDGRRGRARRALPLQRPGALLPRARRQGRHPFPVPPAPGRPGVRPGVRRIRGPGARELPRLRRPKRLRPRAAATGGDRVLALRPDPVERDPRGALRATIEAG
jgi:hypothetical protein